MTKKQLHTIVWKEDKLYIAKFLELELASQGKTKQEAMRNLKEALDLYLEDEHVENLKLPRIDQVSSQIITI